MGQTRKASIGPSLASVVNSIAASQTPAVAGNLTLTATPVVLSPAQRVVFFPAGAEATNGTIWTITGTDWNGNTATETINGVNNPSTAQSVYDYGTVSQISVNKGQSGAVTVGTNGVGSSRPIYLDEFAPGPCAIQVDVVGTVNATVQQTLNDPNPSSGSVGSYTAMNWITHPDTNLVGLTGNVQGNYAYAPRWVRVLLNSGSGSATLRITQLDM